MPKSAMQDCHKRVARRTAVRFVLSCFILDTQARKRPLLIIPLYAEIKNSRSVFKEATTNLSFQAHKAPQFLALLCHQCTAQKGLRPMSGLCALHPAYQNRPTRFDLHIRRLFHVKHNIFCIF